MCEKTHHVYHVLFECHICGISNNTVLSLKCWWHSRHKVMGNTSLRRFACLHCRNKSIFGVISLSCVSGKFDTWNWGSVRGNTTQVSVKVTNID
jgi:hypothetical protein